MSEDELLHLPTIRGFRVVSQHRMVGLITSYLEADDVAGERDLRALLAVVTDPAQGTVLTLSLKPNEATFAVSHAIVKNHCGECGCGLFRRDYKVAGSPKRIVDMLYCEGCGESMRVNPDGLCEGLSPSEAAHDIARQIGNRFKEVWGPAGVDEEYGER